MGLSEAEAAEEEESSECIIDQEEGAAEVSGKRVLQRVELERICDQVGGRTCHRWTEAFVEHEQSESSHEIEEVWQEATTTRRRGRRAGSWESRA